MKLLAVVEHELHACISRAFACEIEFLQSWQDVDIPTLSACQCALISCPNIETANTPIVLWSIASQCRLFNIPALFIDLPKHESAPFSHAYPYVQRLTFQGNFELFFAQAIRCAQYLKAQPHILHDSVPPDLLCDIKPNAQCVGSTHANCPPAKTALTESFEAVSSIPLGMKINPRRSESAYPPAKQTTSQNNNGINISSLDSISSISGISKISPIQSALNASYTPQPPSDGANPIPGIPKNTDSDTIIKRAAKDVLNGNIEFGTLIHIIQTIARLKLTGTLEIKNDTRTVRIEFREGQPFTTSSHALLLSAMGWTTGEYGFDSQKMQSANAQPLDLNLLFLATAHDHLPINPLLQTLELEFTSFVVLTNWFDPAKHSGNTGEWWKKCDGQTRFSEIMMTSGVAMDVISRDVYLAWLCDEIAFRKSPCLQKIQVVYESSPTHKSRQDNEIIKDFAEISNANLTQLNTIRNSLQEMKNRFSRESGYAILGLSPGCGVKALDDAYYSWLNRYHADRFVRYNDAPCIKLANELSMLMNTMYAKISKNERALSQSQKTRTDDEHHNNAINVSQRIGAGRTRISTLSSGPSQISNEKLLSISSELKAIQARSSSDTQQQNIIRPHFHNTPNSNPNLQPISNAIPQNTPQSNAPKQVLRMSEILARREELAQKRARAIEEKKLNRIPPEACSSASPPAVKPWTSQQKITPEQRFTAAKKKIALGLPDDALLAINQAVAEAPDNIEYQIYQAYIGFLANPQTRASAIETILNLIKTVKESMRESPLFKPLLFSAFSFTAKLQISGAEYQAASESLQQASKIDPHDNEILRCIKFVNAQLESPPKEKSLFSRFKDKFKS